ncbi:hypothetical protein TELCIR_16457 [Teladorsagia circumcincta]|uniref:Major facilitator superfamily (MFS) profile domain-containing protein n=1 Tax=Teladorsagia circumcincta TaxID=45464 RepID=A0A2G9TVJ6_TELCI|nr:hypothetical protein TELCIR_16457 [Teladorsagia circumcincta]
MLQIQGVARLIMTLICMAFPEWRISSIACALTALPALLILIFIFPESPTWLNNKGRLEEMRTAERYIARFARVQYKPVVHKKIEHNKVLVAVDTFIPAFSRRTLHQGAQFVVCLCFLTLFFLTMQGYSGIATLIINVTGTIFIEYTWDACYLCAVESMETSCRASATGTCSLMARVGAIIAPVASWAIATGGVSQGDPVPVEVPRREVTGIRSKISERTISELTYANVYWPPALYLAVVIAGFVNLIISYFFLVETKNVNLDSVTLNADPTTEEMVMLENDTAKNERP